MDIEDKIIEEVVSDLKQRSEVGINKYNTTLYESAQTETEFLQHAYEEVLDLANYLKTIIVKRRENGIT